MSDHHPSEPEKLDLASLDIAAQKREELAMLFPEARTEGGKIDFEKLKAVLGEAVDAGRERYGMNWPGKAECMRTIQAPSMGTLLPMPEESVNWETTENVIIEGDNLEVLKLIQKSYLGKVKMIYIDPPYNTGKEFIYPDNFTESLQTYLEYSGQADSDGRKFSANSDTDGRYHTKWLNMMLPRLYLARQLLREDGVCFVSIDDHEQGNLKKLCDEVFGEENHVATLIVQLNPRGRHLDDFVAKTHEYVLVYARDAVNPDVMAGLPKEGKMVDEYNRVDSVGKYRELGLRNRNQLFNRKTRPKLFFPLYVSQEDGSVAAQTDSKHTIEVLPVTSEGFESCWTWGKDKVEKESSLLVARPMDDGSWRVFRKDYLIRSNGNAATTLPKSIWLDSELNNDYGKKAIQDLFGETVMDFPKPPHLIKTLARLGAAEGGIVLDFFAGSGTTGQAVIEANESDGVKRPFILVQLPEPTEKVTIPNLAFLTRERIRRLCAKMRNQDAGRLVSNDVDLGFRAFRLAPSNFIPWDGTAANDADQLAKQLQLSIEHTRDDRTPDDLLYEILLKSWGEPALGLKVAEETVAGVRVFSVADGAFLICLEEEVNLEFIRAVATRKPDRVVMRESAFAGNDQLKTNAVQTFKSQGVTSFKVV